MESEGKPGRLPYLRNFVGLTVDDASMKSVPHAQLELYWHVLAKMAQAGSIIGGVIGAGLGAVRRKTPVLRSTLLGCRNGMLIGMPLSVMMVAGRMNSLQNKNPDVDMKYAYYDRSYRIRNNRNQVRVDRAAAAGFFAGAAAGTMTAGTGLLPGGSVGLAVGTIVGGLYNMTQSKN